MGGEAVSGSCISAHLSWWEEWGRGRQLRATLEVLVPGMCELGGPGEEKGGVREGKAPR